MRDSATPRVLMGLGSRLRDSSRKREERKDVRMQNCWYLGHCLPDTMLVIVHPLFCVIITLTLKKQAVWLLPMKKLKL